MLLNLLGWKSFTQSDLAQSICLDCIYDSVMFCVNKGFTWTEVSCVIKLVCEMLKAAECMLRDIFCKVYNVDLISSVLCLDSICLFECHFDDLITTVIAFDSRSSASLVNLVSYGTRCDVNICNHLVAFYLFVRDFIVSLAIVL